MQRLTDALTPWATIIIAVAVGLKAKRIKSLRSASPKKRGRISYSIQ